MPTFIFFLLSTSIICIALALLPGIALITGIAWGTLLIVAGQYLESSKILLIFLINILLLVIMAGANNLIGYLAFYGIAVIVMTMMLNNGKDYYQIQKMGVISAILGVSLFLLFSHLFSGGIGISELEAELNKSAVENISVYEEMGIFDVYEQMGISQSEMETSLKKNISEFTRHLPAIFYNQAIIAVFLMLLFASNISRKRNSERLKKKSFREESMPWQLVWIAIAGLGLWIWGRDELNNIYYIGSNILWIIVPITIYYGLATLIFEIAEQKQSTRVFLIIGLILMTLIFPLSAIIFVSIIGLFDSLIDFRKLRTGRRNE